MDTAMNEIMKPMAAAEFLGVSYATINRMAADGTLSYSWVRGIRRFKRTDLQAILQTGKRLEKPKVAEK